MTQKSLRFVNFKMLILCIFLLNIKLKIEKKTPLKYNNANLNVEIKIILFVDNLRYKNTI